MRTWLLVPIVAATALLTVVSWSLAGPGTQTTVDANAIKTVSVVRLPGGVSTSFHGFEDVPGATATVNVPAHAHRLVIAQLTTDASCSNRDAVVGPLYCSARIMISAGSGGSFVEMAPQPASHFEVFATDGENGERSIDRSFGPVGPGSYTVKVQFGLPFIGSIGTPSFSLSFTHLTVEAAGCPKC